MMNTNATTKDMYIVRIRGKFCLLTNDGYILHTEDKSGTMIRWCSDNFAGCFRDKTIHLNTLHKVYYDNEHDKYFSDGMLRNEFENDLEKQEEYGSCRAWIEEISGKNGTLTRIEN